MNHILSFLFCMFLFAFTKGQSSYAEAMQQADAAFNKGDYTTAYKKYFAAEAFEPSKKDIVKQKVTKVFNAIVALQKKAEDALAEAKKQTNLAVEAKKDVEKQKALTDTALKESRKQTTLAIEAKKDAENEKQNALKSADEAKKQKEIAEQALKRNIEFQEKAVGKKYKGGIIFYSDTLRDHGLLAAEKDLDSKYTWEEAKKACKNYSVTVDGVTYDDWFLPSKDTLAMLYLNKSAIGSFSPGFYWSSSDDYSQEKAWYQDFGNFHQNVIVKVNTFRVRPVRVF